MDFKDKKVVITGAGPDLGKTLSILFAKMGAELYLSARTLEKVNATAELVRELVPDAKVHTFRLNVSSPDQIAEFGKALSAKTDNVDILINNASYWVQGGLLEVSDEDIVEAISSTATGSVLVTKHVLPLLKNSATPDIININGTPGLENNRHEQANEAFSAAKAAQSTFADRLRYRLKTSGVRVTTIYPPNFENTSPLEEAKWNEQRGHSDNRYLTARNVFESIRFALLQDRICSVDKIILSNNNASKFEAM